MNRLCGPALCAMMMAAAIAAQISAGHARPEELDYEYPSYKPSFVSKQGAFRVQQGDSVELPCQTKDLGPYLIVWRKGKRVISAGSTITAIEGRFQLAGDNSLKIDRVQLRDAGEFVCSVPTDPVIELVHRLDVLYGPTVETVPESGLVVAQKGTDETLECSAQGKPTPQLLWRKQSGLLPSGEKTQAGGQLRLTDISRQMAGLYECVADNGLGQTAVGRVSLQVQYPPEVEVEKSTVYTGEGYTVKLACFVYADPKAKVVWDREGSPLDPTRHVASDDVASGARHALLIRSVRRDDFATYSCQATNSLGSMKRRMIVTGVADRVQVTSATVGTAPDVYDLSWQVESYAPIKEYKVAYRRSKFNASVETPSIWKEVIVPNKGNEAVGETQYEQRITLRNLRPATSYDLYIQARNSHGWNAVSDMFHFSTLTRGEVLESRIAGTAAASGRRLHPLLGAAFVLAFIILPVLF